MRHLLPMELKPQQRPRLLCANLERTCQDRTMAKRLGGEGREQTRALDREEAAGMIRLIGPRDGVRTFQALLAAKDAGREETKVSDRHVRGAKAEPTSSSTARSSRHSDVWVEATQVEMDGLEAAGTVVETTQSFRGC